LTPCRNKRLAYVAVLLALVAAVAVITMTSQRVDTALSANSKLAALQAKYNCAYCSAQEIHEVAALQARLGSRASAMSPPPLVSEHEAAKLKASKARREQRASRSGSAEGFFVPGLDSQP
jgi:hypothetical protein